MLDRHELLLRERLEEMTHRHRAVFAASCAEVLIPNYRTFASESGWGDPAVLDTAVAEAWRCAHDPSSQDGMIANLIERCTEIAPDTARFGEASASAALNSVSAAVAALRACSSSTSRHALDAARATIDTIWGYVQLRDEMDPNDRELEAKITGDPLMKRELSRQIGVLEALRESPKISPSLVERIRVSSPPLLLKFG